MNMDHKQYGSLISEQSQLEKLEKIPVNRHANLPHSIPKQNGNTTGSSFSFYAQLMHHDWHSRVHHRIRQRGWSR